MGCWKPSGNCLDGETRTNPLLGDFTLAGVTDQFDVRTELTAMHCDWAAGRLSADVVRAALPGCWAGFGSSFEAPVTLEMLRAVGPILDSPERMPEQFRVYQGRPSGEPVGIAWSPNPLVAAEYGKRWHAVRKYRGADLPAVLWAGTVQRSDVLMSLWLSSEVIVAPDAVTDLHEIFGPAPAGDIGWWKLAWTDYRAAAERQAAGWVRYLIPRRYPGLVGLRAEVVTQEVVRNYVADLADRCRQIGLRVADDAPRR
jgi:hypothetical protein